MWCRCGHSKTDHPPPSLPSLILEPRGGYTSRNCRQYRSIGGRPVTDFYQLCECGGYYSVHGPLAPIPTANGRYISVPIPTMGGALTDVTSTNPQPTQPFPTSSQMRNMSPYQPHPEYTFGIPIGQPMSHVTGRQPNARASTSTSRTQSTAAARTRKLELTVMFILLPRDLDETVVKDQHGLPNIHYLASGERLAQDLRFLRARNLASTITFRCTTAETNLLPQIAAHIDNMLETGPYKFSSPFNPTNTFLPTASPSEPSYDLRTTFARLPFRFLRIGNGGSASPSLTVDRVVDFRNFTYRKLRERFTRMTSKHPTDQQIHGLIFICPKGGIQLVGPIDDDLSSIHTCYTDYILAGIEKSRYLAQENKTLEQQLEEWKSVNSYSCRTTCPSPNLPTTTPDEEVVTSIIAPTTTLTPIMSTVNLSASINNPVMQNQVVSTQRRAPPLPSRQVYNSVEPSRFHDLRSVDSEIDVQRDLGPDSDGFFCVEGDTVANAAQGLLLILAGIKRSKVAMFGTAIPSLSRTFTPTQFTIKPDSLNLSKIFSCANWFWRAGHEDHNDAVGTGVIREILLEALQQCITSEFTILEETGNSDDFLTIKISPDYVSSETLDFTYALGVICALFMIKAHGGPDPVSPALIQAAIGGFDSLIDHAWVNAISPDLAATLALMPVDSSIPIPDNRDLRRLVESRLTGSRFSDIRRSPPSDRPTLIRSLYINALLGTSEKILKESREFNAFSDGFNLFLTTTLPSFSMLIKSSSKHLLAQTYNRRITTGNQIIPHLKYSIVGDADFNQEIERVLPDIQGAMERYLLGTGHPFPDRVVGLVDPEVLLKDNADPGYRARRFVKTLSGLLTMPASPRNFTVIIYQKVREAALFDGQYEADKDLIPPTPHACLFEVDIWANE